MSKFIVGDIVKFEGEVTEIGEDNDVFIGRWFNINELTLVERPIKKLKFKDLEEGKEYINDNIVYILKEGKS